MNKLIKKIEQWAIDREIHKKGTIEGQSIKTAEEIAELIKGISKDNIALIKDSMGDVFVTLVVGNMLDKMFNIEEIYEEAKRDLKLYPGEYKKVGIYYLAQTITDIITKGYYGNTLYFGLINLLMIVDIYNLDFKDCVESAYNEIANRKGKMINGTFVKSGDLEGEGVLKMKTWQMIKELTESPEKEFISYELGGSRDVLKTKSIDGVIRFSNQEDRLHEVLIGVNLEREWEEVKEPVDFMTAIEALDRGKVIYAINTDGGREIFSPAGKQTDWGVAVLQSQGYAVDTETILYGKWYIED